MNLKESIAEINVKKYVSPPHYGIIKEFIDELGVSNHHFERFYGIPYNIIAQVKLGTKRLPPQYWHFVYEKIVPNIGPGYIKMIEKKYVTKPITKTITNKTPVLPNYASVGNQHDNKTTVAEDSDNHDRLQRVK